jgi:hypothetical protein
MATMCSLKPDRVGFDCLQHEYQKLDFHFDMVMTRSFYFMQSQLPKFWFPYISTRQNINPVRKHCRNWSPVQHISPNGSPWILVDSGMFCMQKKFQLFFMGQLSKSPTHHFIKTVVSPRDCTKHNWHLETHQIHVELCLK